MINFGKRVKELRKAQKITKEEFCGDESELSVRQLTRIESGVSTPTLAKVSYVAQRLGVRIGDLVDEKHFELPKRYKELKYLLLRTQTFMNPEKIAQIKFYIEEILNDFYDNLPEEEQLIVDILDSRIGLMLNKETFAAKQILQEYLEQVQIKNFYTLNDLILIRLYFSFIADQSSNPIFYNFENYSHIVRRLVEHEQLFDPEHLFILNNAILSAASAMLFIDNSLNIEELFQTSERIMQRTQDFQKGPALNLLKWKIAMKSDIECAKIYFQQACLFASMTNDEHLLKMLQNEWNNDQLP